MLGLDAQACSLLIVFLVICCACRSAKANTHGGALHAEQTCLLITNSSFANNAAAGSGGAVYAQGAAKGSCLGISGIHAMLFHTNFTGNTAGQQGGALATNGTSASLTNCRAEGNTARFGGALAAVKGGSFTLAATQLLRNSASASGGAFFATAASLSARDTKFGSNSAQLLGGAAVMQGNGQVELSDCTFDANTAGAGGGALYCNGVDLLAQRVGFVRNSAQRDGGALYCAGGCDWKLDRCTFSANEAAGNGGGLFAWNAAVNASACEFADNTAGLLGGAVSVANTTLRIKGGSVSGNTATGADAGGGGVYLQGGTLDAADVKLDSNMASWGGAVYAANASLRADMCAFVNGTSANGGAGVYALGADVNVSRSTFTQNIVSGQSSVCRLHRMCSAHGMCAL